jgi:hypothetical protein
MVCVAGILPLAKVPRISLPGTWVNRGEKKGRVDTTT